MSCLKNTDIEIRQDRIVIYCKLEDASKPFLSLEQQIKVQKIFPEISNHFCKSKTDKISIPHLYEHLIINNEVKYTSKDDFIFVGTTEWLNKMAGTAKIELNYYDRDMSIRSIEKALEDLHLTLE